MRLSRLVRVTCSRYTPAATWISSPALATATAREMVRQGCLRWQVPRSLPWGETYRRAGWEARAVPSALEAQVARITPIRAGTAGSTRRWETTTAQGRDPRLRTDSRAGARRRA